MSIVCNNLMTKKGYTPYCGNERGCSSPRTRFDGDQFVCPECGWRSKFTKEFILEYKKKWNIE